MATLARARWPRLEVLAPPADAAVTQMAHDIAGRLRAAVEARGQAVLCVSGGKSPVALFEALRGLPLPWLHVTVTLVDERCVPPEHPDSNALLVRTHLLQGVVAQAGFVPMIDAWPPAPAGTASRGVADDVPPGPERGVPVGALGAALDAAARQACMALAGLPGPDVLVLGMGRDGHTASLFLGSPDLAPALDPHNPASVCALRLPLVPPVQPNHPRLTLTLAHILRARHIILPVQGADKLATLAVAARELTAPTLASLPVSHVLHQATTPVSLWLPV